MELTSLSAKIDDGRVCLDEVACRSSEAGIDPDARTAVSETTVGREAHGCKCGPHRAENDPLQLDG